MKKQTKKMMGLGTQVIAGSMIVGALPQNAVTENMSKGYANFSTAFPTVGKLAGAGLTINMTKKLLKTTKKVKL
jgi:hypothetical protein